MMYECEKCRVIINLSIDPDPLPRLAPDFDPTACPECGVPMNATGPAMVEPEELRRLYRQFRHLREPVARSVEKIRKGVAGLLEILDPMTPKIEELLQLLPRMFPVRDDAMLALAMCMRTLRAMPDAADPASIEELLDLAEMTGALAFEVERVQEGISVKLKYSKPQGKAEGG
jgi:hypothetical protein